MRALIDAEFRRTGFGFEDPTEKKQPIRIRIEWTMRAKLAVKTILKIC